MCILQCDCASVRNYLEHDGIRAKPLGFRGAWGHLHRSRKRGLPGMGNLTVAMYAIVLPDPKLSVGVYFRSYVRQTSWRFRSTENTLGSKMWLDYCHGRWLESCWGICVSNGCRRLKRFESSWAECFWASQPCTSFISVFQSKANMRMGHFFVAFLGFWVGLPQ